MFPNYKHDVHNFDLMLNVNVTLFNDYLLRRHVNHAYVHRINVQFSRRVVPNVLLTEVITLNAKKRPPRFQLMV